MFDCNLMDLSIPSLSQDYRYVVYSVGLIISLIFLIATLVISFLVPSNHHALHWRCQTYYVACLLVGDFFLAITQLAGDAILEPYCSIVGKWILVLTRSWMNESDSEGQIFQGMQDRNDLITGRYN